MKSFFIICVVFSSLVTNAQLITYEASPNALINSNFLGQAYEISNVQYSGYGSAKGQFIGTSSNLGLTDGIVLTTGTVLGNENGPIGPNNSGSAGLDNNMVGYAPLTAIANEDTQNAAVLEFDFIPSIDSISLKYVFGSDEYPEFVNSGYNDVFGFFISGPGIAGTVNIAIVPGSLNTPITTDNVNDSVNSVFYVNNGDGTQAPQNGSDVYLQYDGFTTGLVAYTDLVIGESYHLVIAIADVSDGTYDSGLFIEKCVTCIYEVGLKENNINNVLVYPNPCKGFVNILNDYNGELIVYDVIGDVIKIFDIQSGHTVVDVNDLINGVYYFAFSNGISNKFEKIVINK